MNEQYSEEEDMLCKDFEVKRIVLFSRMRSSLYKKILRQVDGLNQWRFITGKILRRRTGERVYFTKKTLYELQDIVDYYNSMDGSSELLDLGLALPDHIDDVVNWVREAFTSRELSSYIFKFALKKFRKDYVTNG